MRPGSFDEVLAAYLQAIQNRQALKDRLTATLETVNRLTAEIDSATATIRTLRDEVKTFGACEVAA